jgi:hypothetical protein
MNDTAKEQIHEATKILKTAIENMGGSRIVILYAYVTDDGGSLNDGEMLNTGFIAEGSLAALGAAEMIKKRIMN